MVTEPVYEKNPDKLPCRADPDGRTHAVNTGTQACIRCGRAAWAILLEARRDAMLTLSPPKNVTEVFDRVHQLLAPFNWSVALYRTPTPDCWRFMFEQWRPAEAGVCKGHLLTCEFVFSMEKAVFRPDWTSRDYAREITYLLLKRTVERVEAELDKPQPQPTGG